MPNGMGGQGESLQSKFKLIYPSSTHYKDILLNGRFAPFLIILRGIYAHLQYKSYMKVSSFKLHIKAGNEFSLNYFTKLDINNLKLFISFII